MMQPAGRKIRPPPPPLDADYKPSVRIAELPIIASVDEMIEILDRDGAFILNNLLSPEQLAQVEKDTLDWTGDKAINQNGLAIVPKETLLVGGLVGKSPTMASLCEHPHLVELRRRILTEEGSRQQEEIDYPYHIDPLLSLSLSFCVRSGAPRQRLHRDDIIHVIDHSLPYKLEKVSQFACLIAGVKTTMENRATMFVPGSHRWDEKRLPRTDEVTFAEMEPGSALIFLAGAYHGAGHNSVKDFTRVVHGLFFCRGIYRTEENQFLAIPRSKNLLGYKLPDVPLGMVENSDVMTDLKGVLERASV
ncbi:hypothetical protein HYALB_00007164 [Hymenoscyphus albidus]|uniref:Phytanoyl-CoA dioxygenase n=1 Tax=Hymenoscyphus albidus TaxID=595503 RepID=A0A9N9QAP2_9HELO|nr:hypothetical protein HYALB_00007164 [Hymenoscyphus albidus]